MSKFYKAKSGIDDTTIEQETEDRYTCAKETESQFGNSMYFIKRDLAGGSLADPFSRDFARRKDFSWQKVNAQAFRAYLKFLEKNSKAHYSKASKHAMSRVD